jgi:DNA-binding NarL/FixJ family response regulator
MEKIRIFIADDHAVLRSGLTALLSRTPHFHVAGEAGDGWQALEAIEALRPDVVIMDLSMPGLSGIQCIKEIRYRKLPCHILVLTMYEEEEYIKEAMLAGADGFVPKKSADTELITGINRVAAGKKYLNDTLSQSLLANLLRTSFDRPESHDPYHLLSAREREVLRLLAQGHTNSEIGVALSISPKTVDTYRGRLMHKLRLNKKSELVNYALQHKLIHMPV